MPEASQLVAGGRARNERYHRKNDKKTIPIPAGSQEMLAYPPGCGAFYLITGGVAPLNRPATSYDASGIKKNSGQEAFSF